METAVNEGDGLAKVHFTGIDREVERVADYADGRFVPRPERFPGFDRDGTED